MSINDAKVTSSFVLAIRLSRYKIKELLLLDSTDEVWRAKIATILAFVGYMSHLGRTYVSLNALLLRCFTGTTYFTEIE